MIQKRQRQQGQQQGKRRHFHKAFLVVAFTSFTYSIASELPESSCTATTDNDVNDDRFSPRHLHHGVLDWISRQPGAYYNPKQVVDSRDGMVGVFATAPIAKGELLCRIPWEWTIRGDDGEDDQLSCGLVRVLVEHLDLGPSSKYGPYIEYLHHQPDHLLVSAWSRPGQELILKIMGQTRQENNDELYYRNNPLSLANHFPPLSLTSWLDGEWQGTCHGTESGHKAALMVLSRSDDALLIPGYDFYNHRNGPWRNADTEIILQSAHVTRAIRDIQAGEQIYISYNRCLDCEGRHEGYGTAEIFRDYGFIEVFPQRWHYYTGDQVEFELHDFASSTNSTTASTGYHTYMVEWISKPRGSRALTIQAWMQQQVRRLERVWHLDYYRQGREAAIGVTEFEWNLTWAFQQANLVALRAAIQALSSTTTPKKVNVTIGQHVDENDKKDVLQVDVLDLYHPLDQGGLWNHIDSEILRCSMTEFDDYEEIDSFVGFLQNIEISHATAGKTADRPVCMDRNGQIHVCSSFRSTYFEYFVHPAASLLTVVKRVLIMGSGASFLLHEIMRYNATLEFAVVLEPDPAVTRLSQKHFGVDPYWHDPRIQWWFGEIGEVLTLLDDEHWNTFDLVLIDLPMASFGQTFRNGITMSDLVHENGIIVSHTNQWQEFSEVFEYTARSVYRLTPTCAHVLTLASPTIDFMRAPAKDHGLKDTAWYQPTLMEPGNRLQFIQAWQSGGAMVKDASLGPAMVKDTSLGPAEEVGSFHDPLGVLEVLELVSFQRGGLEGSVAKIKEALRQIDLAVLSTISLYVSSSVQLVLDDGYIVIRAPGPQNYLGLDLYWSKNVGSLPLVKTAIVEVLAASVTSAFRLVSNGAMPPAIRVPKLTTGAAASTRASKARGELEISRVIKLMLKETLDTKALGRVDNIILVVCESLGRCLARDSVNNLDSTKKVNVLEMCNSDGTTAKSVKRILECERTSRSWLQSNLIDQEIFADAIVLDGDLSTPSLQVFDAIVNDDPPVAWGTWIPFEIVLVVLPSSLGGLSNAHRVFEDRFQYTGTIVKRPQQGKQKIDNAVLAEFSLAHLENGNAEVGIVISGLNDSVAMLRSLENSFGEVMPNGFDRVSLRKLQGGPLRSIPLLTVKRNKRRSTAEPALPVGIQSFFQAHSPSKKPTSLRVVSASTVFLLRSMNLEKVTTLTTDEAFNSTVIEFDDGHLIMSMHGRMLDFNLFYLCKGRGEADKACTTDFAYDVVDLLFDELTDWSIFALDVLPRGAASNMDLRNGHRSRYGMGRRSD